MFLFWNSVRFASCHSGTIRTGSLCDTWYTKSHEWIRKSPSTPLAYQMGITKFASDKLGEIIYAELPDQGQAFEKDLPMFEIESVKSCAFVNAPVSCTIARHNPMCDNYNMLVVNESPEEAGWILEIYPFEKSEIVRLMDSDEYVEFCKSIE